MSTITVRLNKEEQKLFEEYAMLQGQPLSTLLKKSLEEKIEDNFDIEAIKNYEENIQKDNVEFYSHEEVKKSLGIIEWLLKLFTQKEQLKI